MGQFFEISIVGWVYKPTYKLEYFNNLEKLVSWWDSNI
jgi:hypothetical protein